MLLALGAMTTALAQPIETVLHNFSASMPKGAQPIGALIRDAQGTLYGATESGGQAWKRGHLPGFACRGSHGTP